MDRLVESMVPVYVESILNICRQVSIRVAVQMTDLRFGTGEPVCV